MDTLTVDRVPLAFAQIFKRHSLSAKRRCIRNVLFAIVQNVHGLGYKFMALFQLNRASITCEGARKMHKDTDNFFGYEN
jgi:hypothetical protein